MEIKCPKCGREVSNSNINISTDLGKCDRCNSVFKLSECVSKEEISRLSAPPFGSKISLSKNGENLEITLPAKKFGINDIFPLVFSLVWVGFISVWTFMAIQGGIFVIFSIPFWIIGVSMIVSLVNSLDEDQIITIYNDRLELVKNRPVNSKKYSMGFNDIYSIRMGNINLSNPFSMAGNIRLMTKFNGFIQAPSINSGNDSITFFEFGSEAEKDWIIKLLNAVAGKNEVREQKSEVGRAMSCAVIRFRLRGLRRTGRVISAAADHTLRCAACHSL